MSTTSSTTLSNSAMTLETNVTINSTTIDNVISNTATQATTPHHISILPPHATTLDNDIAAESCTPQMKAMWDANGPWSEIVFPRIVVIICTTLLLATILACVILIVLHRRRIRTRMQWVEMATGVCVRLITEECAIPKAAVDLMYAQFRDKNQYFYATASAARSMAPVHTMTSVAEGDEEDTQLLVNAEEWDEDERNRLYDFMVRLPGDEGDSDTEFEETAAAGDQRKVTRQPLYMEDLLALNLADVVADDKHGARLVDWETICPNDPRFDTSSRIVHRRKRVLAGNVEGKTDSLPDGKEAQALMRKERDRLDEVSARLGDQKMITKFAKGATPPQIRKQYKDEITAKSVANNSKLYGKKARKHRKLIPGDSGKKNPQEQVEKGVAGNSQDKTQYSEMISKSNKPLQKTAVEKSEM